MSEGEISRLFSVFANDRLLFRSELGNEDIRWIEDAYGIKDEIVLGVYANGSDASKYDPYSGIVFTEKALYCRHSTGLDPFVESWKNMADLMEWAKSRNILGYIRFSSGEDMRVTDHPQAMFNLIKKLSFYINSGELSDSEIEDVRSKVSEINLGFSNNIALIEKQKEVLSLDEDMRKFGEHVKSYWWVYILGVYVLGFLLKILGS